MKKLLIPLLIMSLFSCVKNQTTVSYTSFDEVDTLTAEIHPIPPIMLYPRGMFLTDSFLVVLNDKMDTCFQVFDKQRLTYLYNFGLHGEGPEDFRMPSGQIVSNNLEETLILDFNHLKSIEFVNGKPQISTKFLPVQLKYYNGLLKLTDSTYVCEADYEDEKEYIFISGDGTSKQAVDYPEEYERFGSVLERNQAYGRIAGAHPSGKCFASFYTSDHRFRIIDNKGKILHDIILNTPERDAQIPVNPEERRIHTLAVYTTENYIYTLNLDMKPAEIYSQKKLPSIQIFSWDGIPLKQLYLNHFISSFTVDEKAQTIYGAFAENEAEIYTFHL